ncbi:MAG: ABC transporter ATP-binding protein/permease [Candidatus Heimdallarchaeum endolithica]|uniref:ABC transporter ATP-binding protein/permease n=1 Tax=Candidatus Heimdallarchaeum endolithica TaxID=2876572 RepID=A0A9Y1BV10_9ARCH|nr:MAG: ABC transporter ATP-binding protein/permease [Candidatus Heimdallarchaeum endolithica]
MKIQTENDIRGEFYNPIMDKFNKKTHFKWILSHLFAHKKLVFSFLLFSTMSALIAAIIPVLTGNVVNAILEKENWEIIKKTALIILFLTIISGIVRFFSGLIIEIVSQRLEKDIRDEYYASMLSKSMTFHDEVKAGDVMARATFDTRMVNFIANPILSLLYSALVNTSFSIVTMIVISPYWNYMPVLLLIPLVIAFPIYITAKRYFKKVGPISMEIQESFSNLSSYLQEKLLGIIVVKSFAKENYEREAFNQKNNLLSDQIIIRGKLRSKYYPALIIGIGVGLSIIWGSLLIQWGLFNIGELITYSLLVGNLTFPIWVLSWTLVFIQMSFAGADRIVSILNKETIVPESPDAIDLEIKGDVEFKNVSFSYDNEVKVLKDISFKIPAGKRCAIVGPAGCGKTTIMKLLTRLYDVSEGEILIDGINIKDLSFKTLRKNIGVIEQDIVLFSASIRENISYGKPEATEEEIIEAAKMAQAHEFIMKFDKQYDTIIGERGTTLSGGQKQRIAIARMLLSNPQILVFDDASSAVDSETEDQINRAINRVLANRTSFTITHRLSVIRNSDIIIVLKNGEIKAIGSHEQLLKSSVDYWRVFARFSEIRKMMPKAMQHEHKLGD